MDTRFMHRVYAALMSIKAPPQEIGKYLTMKSDFILKHIIFINHKATNAVGGPLQTMSNSSVTSCTFAG